jgi:hypothetical protein
MKKLIDWYQRKFHKGEYVWNGVFLTDNVPEGFNPKAPQDAPLVEEEVKVKRLFPE